MTEHYTSSIYNTKCRAVERTTSSENVRKENGAFNASTRTQSVVAVGGAERPVGKSDAGYPQLRFDERGRRTGRCPRARPRLYESRAVCGTRWWIPTPRRSSSRPTQLTLGAAMEPVCCCAYRVKLVVRPTRLHRCGLPRSRLPARSGLRSCARPTHLGLGARTQAVL